METRSNRVRNDLYSTGHNLRYNDPLYLPNPNTNIPTNRTSNISTSEEADILTTGGESPIRNSGEAQPIADGSIDGPRRSARDNKGQYNSTRNINEVFMSEVKKWNHVVQHIIRSCCIRLNWKLTWILRRIILLTPEYIMLNMLRSNLIRTHQLPWVQ